MTLLVVVVIIAAVALVVVALYNSLVRARNTVDNAWSQIDVQLKRRLDLIPNLVETVKGYAAQEEKAPAWAKATIAKYPAGKQASAVIPVLWRAQEQEGWCTEPAIRAIAELLDMAYIRVYEIATFYTMFQLSPVGKKAHVQVCGTTPCMLRGSEALI
ncbi:MAG: NAD(P)H-dependent oxidoreductase subunit E, partial [Ilumatobacteraceae bacterium]